MPLPQSHLLLQRTSYVAQDLFFDAVFDILHALLPKDGKGAAENRDH
jgi:hypothetical protein